MLNAEDSPPTVSQETLERLGWPRILEAAAEGCASDLGRARVLGLPLRDAAGARAELAAVAAILDLRARDAAPPLGPFEDVRPVADRCARGGVGDGEELAAVGHVARLASRVRRHLLHHAERGGARVVGGTLGGTPGAEPSEEPEADGAPSPLSALAAALPDLDLLGAELEATFDEGGRIRDDASPQLTAARRRRDGLHRALKARLERMLKDPEILEVLQDDYYTLRDDRYVLPVVASRQSQLPGIIHGVSNTGQTVFLEPAILVDANNQIKVAEAAVEAARHAVLLERSAWVAEEAPAIRDAVDALARLDGLNARALFAERVDGHVPRVGRYGGEVRLLGARNPHLVLRGDVEVVPNDLTLEPEHAFLVVTGPNTGGKTVTLSTLGVCTLMAHAGLPVPARADSVIAPVRALFALVGDSQDITHDLSTFSGHLLSLQRVLAQVEEVEPREGALVLLDEIVVGTEPVQGAALAIALLEALADRGARGLVTTHYERLKALPFEDPRFVNASVGVDPETLAPNFRLTQGRPGASTPFEVALRLGLDPALVQRAREVAGAHGGLSEALDRVAAAERAARQAQEAAERARAEAAEEARRLAAAREELRRRADEEIRARAKEALGAIDEAMEQVRGQVRHLRGVRSADELESRRRALRSVKEKIEVVEREHRPKPQEGDGRPEGERRPTAKGPRDGGDLSAKDLKPGLPVWVRTVGQPGEVTEIRGKGQAVVAVGALKLTLKARDLGRLEGGEPPRPTPPRRRGRAVQAPARRERPVRCDDLPDVPPPRTEATTLDLRGARRDEVEDQLERALDRAFMAEQEVLWIIHGHGSGAIRDEARAVVRRSEYVRQWRPGRRHEGGDGATIVWLRAR